MKMNNVNLTEKFMKQKYIQLIALVLFLSVWSFGSYMNKNETHSVSSQGIIKELGTYQGH